MKKKLPVELDFIQEGHNAEKISRLLGHFRFLKVYIQSSSLAIMGGGGGGQWGRVHPEGIYRILKCDVIKFAFLHFSIFMTIFQ